MKYVCLLICLYTVCVDNVVPEYVFAGRKCVVPFEKDRPASSAYQVGQEESRGVSRALDGFTMSLKMH
jgi:hypothetical protein